MNANRRLLKITGVALVAVAGSIAAACGSSNSNPPSMNLGDGGSSGGSSGSGSGSSSSGTSTSSSSSGGSSSSGTSSTSSGSSSGGTDASSSGSCVPDGGPDAQCNSCATIGGSQTYNTCSQFLVNCQPFNNAARGVPNPLPSP